MVVARLMPLLGVNLRIPRLRTLIRLRLLSTGSRFGSSGRIVILILLVFFHVNPLQSI
jgi:hypothetical protein